ncbi:MAG TPA: hypothetical protein VKB19_08935, partial [Pedobacter sp.]|nr:hypothetical protein [Pedobacter sp.]
MTKLNTNDGGISRGNQKNSISIDSQELIITALEIMLTNKQFELSVFEDERDIGTVHFKELIFFLAQEHEIADIFIHKLN